jgi:hypothetical protein
MVPRVLLGRNSTGRTMGSEIDRPHRPIHLDSLFDDDRRIDEEVFRQSRRCASIAGIWECRLYFPVPGSVFNGVDTSVGSIAYELRWVLTM